MKKVLVDTQIFIFWHAQTNLAAVRVLDLLGDRTRFELVLSPELQQQILRVGRRVGGKDWAGSLVDRVWQNFRVNYVSRPTNFQTAESTDSIPREDVAIYLAAVVGKIDVLISENREFVRQAAAAQNLFECLTMQEFLERYDNGS